MLLTAIKMPNKIGFCFLRNTSRLGTLKTAVKQKQICADYEGHYFKKSIGRASNSHLPEKEFTPVSEESNFTAG